MENLLDALFGKALFGHAMVMDAALLQQGYGVTVTSRKVEIMNADEDGFSCIAQTGQQFHDFKFVQNVQGAGRFIEENDRRFGGQGPGQTHQLSLTAGQLVDEPVAENFGAGDPECSVDDVQIMLA